MRDWPLKGACNRSKSKPNSHCPVYDSVFVAVIPAKAGIQRLWIPGRVALARNDDPTPENVNPVLDTGPPAELGVYLDANEEARC